MARTQRSVLIETVVALVAAGMAVAAACLWAGLPRATFYRITRGYRHYTPVPDPVPQRARQQPAALTCGERAQVRAILEDDQYANLSIYQTYWRAFDSGRMPCSQSSFYRIAKAEQMTGDRRRGRHSGNCARPVPKAVATAPGQLWSWDVTELKGPSRQRYKLYLVIDVFSRYPVSWRIEHSEDTTLAVQMFATAFTRYGAPQVLHADNGAIMRSHRLLDELHAAQIEASFSRPRVSDDNPFSESLFKTIKYDLNCPDRFDSIEHARTWTTEYLHGYASEHRHSGLAWHTPQSVFDGTATAARQHRQTLLDRNYHAHPQRFRRRPRAPEIPTIVGINHRRTTNHPLSQTG